MANTDAIMHHQQYGQCDIRFFNVLAMLTNTLRKHQFHQLLSIMLKEVQEMLIQLPASLTLSL
ncbi:MAG: hypothetical protein J6S67_21645 [Methanobrevibacter sp.]|nr:hypothetical protein [Methanobrevibacter sp.]